MNKSDTTNKSVPVFKIPVYKDHVYLALHPTSWAPTMYALTLPWSKRGIGIELEPIVYTFRTCGERNDFYGAVKHVMEYQHTDPMIKAVVTSYQSDINSFKQRMAEIEKQNTR